MAPEIVEMEWVEMVRGIEEEKRLATTVGAMDMFLKVRGIHHFTSIP